MPAIDVIGEPHDAQDEVSIPSSFPHDLQKLIFSPHYDGELSEQILMVQILFFLVYWRGLKSEVEHCCIQNVRSCAACRSLRPCPRPAPRARASRSTSRSKSVS